MKDFTKYAGGLLFLTLTGLLLICSDVSIAQSPDWEWASSAGGINYDRGQAVTYTADGNLIVSGYFIESATFDTTILTSALSVDLFIAKYTTAGSLLWVKSVASSATFATADAVYEDDAGNIYIAGTFGVYSSTGGGGDITFDEFTSFISKGNQDIFLAKYDPEANFIWAEHIGSTESDIPVSTLDESDNIILSGKLWSTVYFNSTIDTLYPYHLFDIFLAKYDTAGTLLFYRNAASCTAVIEPQDVTTDPEGNIYLSGKYNGKPTFGLPVDTVDIEEDPFYDQGFIARYEPIVGLYQWAFTAGNTASFDYPLTLDFKGGGKLVMSGRYMASASFGILPDTITLEAPSSAGYGEMYLVQYDTSGNADWAINAGHATAGGLNFQDADYNSGHYYITGDYSAGPAFFGQGADMVTITALHAIFVTDYDDSGDLVWANYAGGFYYEGAEGVIADTLNNVYITGFYLSECAFPGTPFTIISAGYEDIMVARLDDVTVSVREMELDKGIFIFPNPATEKVTVNPGLGKYSSLQLVNLQGRVLLEIQSDSKPLQIDISDFPDGFYIIRISDEHGNRVANKLIIR